MISIGGTKKKSSGFTKIYKGVKKRLSSIVKADATTGLGSFTPNTSSFSDENLCNILEAVEDEEEEEPLAAKHQVWVAPTRLELPKGSDNGPSTPENHLMEDIYAPVCMGIGVDVSVGMGV